MKITLKIMVLELEHLLLKKLAWVFMAAYAASALFICLSDGFRQSYFSDTGSVAVTLAVSVAPYFLVVILVSTLSPVFAGDKERDIYQIPAACLVGRRGRSVAKALASMLFSAISCSLMGTVTIAAVFACGLFDGGQPLEYPGIELSAEWTVSQYLTFSLVCLVIGCTVLTLFLLYISCSVTSVITAVSLSSFLVLFEFIFHRFSFPIAIKEYNVWMFFKPYSFWCMRELQFSPFVNLLILTVAFLPVCSLALWGISQKGT